MLPETLKQCLYTAVSFALSQKGSLAFKDDYGNTGEDYQEAKRILQSADCIIMQPEAAPILVTFYAGRNPSSDDEDGYLRDDIEPSKVDCKSVHYCPATEMLHLTCVSPEHAEIVKERFRGASNMAEPFIYGDGDRVAIAQGHGTANGGLYWIDGNYFADVNIDINPTTDGS